jgi:hypothetical protein
MRARRPADTSDGGTLTLDMTGHDYQPGHRGSIHPRGARRA